MSDNQVVSRVGKRGTVVIPTNIRKDFGIKEGSLVIAEKTAAGVLIRPAIALPIQTYTAEEKAEFILSNSLDEDDYLKARETVKEMGLNPDDIRHIKPKQTVA